jgi:purine-nucleoside phosphorylase
MSTVTPITHKIANKTLSAQLSDTVAAIVSAYSAAPKVAVILGSGLGGFAEQLPTPTALKYSDLPHFPKQVGDGVSGHKGQLLLSPWKDSHIVCLQGRFHYYEGYDSHAVTYPIRLLKALGVETLIVTNAAGGINPQFRAGDLMLINDHLNLTGRNPLIGPNDDTIGPRFPDMTEAYSLDLKEKAKAIAAQHNIPLQQGVYAGLLGPCYETPAEVKMLQGLGADAVGMSTVAEVITARHAGLNIVGISCITNAAAAEGNEALNHQEVLDAGRAASQRFETLVSQLIDAIAD